MRRRRTIWRRIVYMRRLVVAALTMVAAVGLSGCSIGAPVGESRAGDAAVRGLTVWVMKDDFGQSTIDEINRRFESKTGVKVNVQVQPWDGIATKLTTALATADPPDVVDIGNTKVMDFAMNGGLMDLSAQQSELSQGQTWLPGLKDPAMVDGRLYAVPAFGATRAVIYNKRIWQKAGVTEVPSNLEQLEKALDAVAAHAHDEDFCPFYLPGKNWFAGLQFVWAAGGDVAFRNGVTWVGDMASEQSQRGLRAWQEFQRQYSSAASVSAETANPDMSQLFAQEKTSALLWNSAAIAKILSINPSLTRDDIGTFPMPDDEGGAQPTVMAGSDLAIPARSNNQSLALEWVRIAVSSDIQRDWIARRDGWLPNSKELVDEFLAGDGLDDAQRGFFQAAKASRATPAAAGWSTIEADGSLKELFADVASGKSIPVIAAAFDHHADEVFMRSGGMS